MIYDSTRHVPVINQEWSRDEALEVCNKFYDFLCNGRQENGLWVADKDEEAEIPFNKRVYFGAAGTVWGLNQLATLLNRKLPFDMKEISAEIYRKYLEEPDTKSVVPSALLGEAGILELCHKFAPTAKITERLRTVIESNISNPTNEALWGCPGTMLVALRVGEFQLYKASADYLFDQWTQLPEGYWVWQQDLYGKTVKLIGAGHGFYGNIQPLLAGFQHLETEQKNLLLQRIIQTTLVSATRENGLANWLPVFETKELHQPRTQWCHGSPGVITSLKDFPKNESAELEKLLLEAGEAIWASGPLKKGIGICHGTDGNGFAFLRLFERTKDPVWLTRARQFAMHAISQRNGRYTLWTGEVGLALYLMSCVNETADFPSLDYF